MDEAKLFKQRPNIGSRVTREGHARFWERPEVQFLRATRHRVFWVRGSLAARERAVLDPHNREEGAPAMLPSRLTPSRTPAKFGGANLDRNGVATCRTKVKAHWIMAASRCGTWLLLPRSPDFTD